VQGWLKKARRHRSAGASSKGCVVRLGAAALLLLSLTGEGRAQQSLRDALRGYSVVVQYSEDVVGRRRSASLVWTQAIYISTEGRLFTHVTVAGARGGQDRHFDVTPDSNNSGGATPFRWTATGFTRSWVNHRGKTIGQTIEIRQAGAGFTCSMNVEHMQGFVSSTHQICKVVKGNALKGM
jgi:hypothetical protein